MQIENFKLEQWINEREPYAKYDLSQTCVCALSLEELAKISDEDFSSLMKFKLSYKNLYGSDSLKQAICNLYKNQKFENITVTLGGIGANELVLKTLINKGDKVVCILPCYQQSYALPKFYGADVHFYFLNDKDWSIDKEKFKNIVGNNTKLICLTSPNNPTGKVFSNEEMNFIVKTAENCGAYIFADEVYRGLNHEQSSYSQSFADIYNKGISTGSMSKTYSLAGIRLGWIVASKDIIEKINLNRQYNTICISILDDFVATIALKNHEKIVKRNLKIIKDGKQLVKNFISKNPQYSWVEPNSATIGSIKFQSNLHSFDFCEKMYKDTGVLTVPASVFEGKNFFRLGYAMGTEYLQDALNLISKWN